MGVNGARRFLTLHKCSLVTSCHPPSSTGLRSMYAPRATPSCWELTSRSVPHLSTTGPSLSAEPSSCVRTPRVLLCSLGMTGRDQK